MLPVYCLTFAFYYALTVKLRDNSLLIVMDSGGSGAPADGAAQQRAQYRSRLRRGGAELPTC